MGMGVDVGHIRMILQCLIMIKPVIKPIMKEAIKSVKIQRQGNKK